MDTYIAIVESKYEKTDVVHALGSKHPTPILAV